MKLTLKLILVAAALLLAAIVNTLEESWKKFRLGDDYEGPA